MNYVLNFQTFPAAVAAVCGVSFCPIQETQLLLVAFSWMGDRVRKEIPALSVLPVRGAKQDTLKGAGESADKV